MLTSAVLSPVGIALRQNGSLADCIHQEPNVKHHADERADPMPTSRPPFEVLAAYAIGAALPVAETFRRRTNFDDFTSHTMRDLFAA